MPRSISLSVRHRIVSLHGSGHSRPAIALEVGVGLSTVKTLLKRYQQTGESGLLPHYDRCGPQAPRSPTLVVRQYLCLKRWHLRWGYDKISSLIRTKYPGLTLPDRRTVYRWWRQRGLLVKASQPPKPPDAWARAVHEVWQIDAKEMIYIQTAAPHCWLNIVDEYTGGIIDPPVFPPR